ncbi:hypothetical protein HOE31_04395 [bacterium]|jgi:hypothetical protein|nr:hypothetical protein [bacterium]MBT4122159.1 hypothetical protein [bacterium]MBT4335675.1 hypothetical protein [bacterium]MBT4495850.1 hypothetical protein [bacterium]MBT4763571.1 hypothetical protein [bacterium]
MESSSTVKGVIEGFQDKHADISLDDKSHVLWPIKNLSEEVTVNTRVRITLSTNNNELADKEEMARIMLNNILNAENIKK